MGLDNETCSIISGLPVQTVERVKNLYNKHNENAIDYLKNEFDLTLTDTSENFSN